MTTWSEIEAEANASGFRERLVEVYRKYEGQSTDERDSRGQPVRVSIKSFAEHLGIPERTFNRWVNVAAAATQPEQRDRTEEDLRRASPERKRQIARKLLDDPEVANDPGVRARVTSEPSAERMEQQRDFEERQRRDRQSRHGMRYINASDNLVKIKRLARDTLSECQGVEFDAEERELLGHDIDQALAALNLLKAGVVGSSDVDWDVELSKLGDLS